MRYQVGPNGEWLRSSPVYDTFPICARATCKNAEALDRSVLDAMSSVYGPPVASDVVTGGERRGVESLDDEHKKELGR